jgi:anhydro-N-acetylmuramic acid kinase
LLDERSIVGKGSPLGSVRRVVGLMSGTSADGVDAAVVELSGHAESTELGQVVFRRIPYTPVLREKVLALMLPETSRVDEICRMNFVLGEVFADAALQAIKAAGLETEDIDFVGSHGQTIYHIPGDETYCGITTRSTLQIGEPAVIAERTGVTTVADFRVRDVAAGGQGAPLVSYADYILLRDAEKSRVIQNIGGIGNLTFLPGGCSLDEVIAFDTGPGNMVIDAVVSIITGGRLEFDEDGKIAASGNVVRGLLDWALSHPFFRKAPPKTTGREEFGIHFAKDMVSQAQAEGIGDFDLVATVTALTAESIAMSYEEWVLPICKLDQVIIGGGGSYNRTLLDMLSQRLPGIEVMVHEDLGISSDAKEAIAFAILANDAVAGCFTNVPRATGARRGVVLGKIVPGRR